MKNIIISLLAIFTFVNCTGLLEETSTYDKDYILLNIYNGPMSTKATNPGDEYERQIKRLDCFFFVKDALNSCVYYQKVTNTEEVIGRQEIPFFVDATVINKIFPGTNTTCDVYVIANYPGNGDWSDSYESTTVEDLNKIVLDLFDKEADGTTNKHDAFEKPFVMSGLDIATKGINNSAKGTIPLVRAASKITLKLKIPEWIQVEEVIGDDSAEGTTTTTSIVEYYPYLNPDGEGKVPFRTTFSYGVSKTYLNADYNGQLVENDYFTTHDSPTAYNNPVFTEGKNNSPGYYTCDIEVPFYSYARAWNKGANNAPYLTLQIPWKKYVDGNEVVSTYYYQILVNSGGLTLSPNSWYDLTVKVGVLGSLTESTPTEIKSDDITYYILDWTKEPSQDEGDRYEDVVIKEYAYLEVPEKRIIINNSNVGYIPYYASHPITVSMDATSRTDEILNSTTSLSAFYIDGNSISLKSLDITSSNFSISEDKPGYLKYDYSIPDNVYSPVYVYININMQAGDQTFSEKVTIVQYPPMYVIPEYSTLRSIYVNGNRDRYTSTSLNTYTMGSYPLGSTTGVRNFDGDNEINNYPMYIINVSSFNKAYKFDAPYIDQDGYFIDVKTSAISSVPTQPSITSYNYIIGDPRVTIPDNNLGGNNVQNLWTEARALVRDDGSKVTDTDNYSRKLSFYYPTESSGESFKIVAPKFRIVSFNNASGKHCTHLSAAMRCASLQEDGFPAGRWRLPTVAEIQFIIMLQENKAIQEIFTSSGSYYATASFSNSDHSSRIAVTYRNGKLCWNSLNSNISVRCVYDDWYWGSNRDAFLSTDIPEYVTDNKQQKEHTNKYMFTWGDEPKR